MGHQQQQLQQQQLQQQHPQQLQHQQQHQQHQQHHQVEQGMMRSVNDVIPTVTVTLPASQTGGLLDPFSQVDSNPVLQVPTSSMMPDNSILMADNSVAVHGMEHVHGTSTISAEGVLLFRASLPSMSDVKDFPGMSG